MLITLEGIEGSGKTTQIRRMAAHFESLGRACTVTREPGGTAIGKEIRAILLNPIHRHIIHPTTELLLYAADRAQHVREQLLPLLKTGHVVICDRFYDSTTVYQGHARGLDMNTILMLHDVALEGLKPDMTFVLDLSAEIGLARAWRAIRSGDRQEGETRFERETLDFHEKVRNGYLSLARLEPDRMVVVDAAASPDLVWEAIRRRLPSFSSP